MIKENEYYEKLYVEFFGISEFNPEGTTINKSVIRFVEYLAVVEWAEKMDKNIKWE